MILIVDNDPIRRIEAQHTFFSKFALNTCGSSTDETEETLLAYPVAAVYVPYAEALPDPIGFCRAFKLAHPNIPLIAAVPKDDPGLDLDILYGVTDNIPFRPITPMHQAEIICEMIRMYTGRDRLEQNVGGVTLSIYTFSVIFCGRVSTFSVGEVSILHHLAAQAPRPVPVSELARCTGGPRTRHETDGRIRQRISIANQHAVRVFGRPLIANIRGKGYVIDPYAKS